MRNTFSDFILLNSLQKLRKNLTEVKPKYKIWWKIVLLPELNHISSGNETTNQPRVLPPRFRWYHRVIIPLIASDMHQWQIIPWNYKALRNDVLMLECAGKPQKNIKFLKQIIFFFTWVGSLLVLAVNVKS